ncbi:unnamed protein product [Symbiodinium sp. CCMP2592]|nr:unnamed protein product [Symbiodinium sp. CCMP2592]
MVLRRLRYARAGSILLMGSVVLGAFKPISFTGSTQADAMRSRRRMHMVETQAAEKVPELPPFKQFPDDYDPDPLDKFIECKPQNFLNSATRWLFPPAGYSRAVCAPSFPRYLQFPSVFTVFPSCRMPNTPVIKVYSAPAKTHILHLPFLSVFTVFPQGHMPNTPLITVCSALATTHIAHGRSMLWTQSIHGSTILTSRSDSIHSPQSIHGSTILTSRSDSIHSRRASMGQPY